MVMHEQLKNLKLAIPDHPGMFHSQDDRDELFLSLQSESLTKKSSDENEYDITVIRQNATVSVCVNGYRVIDWTEVSYWKPPHIMSRLPFSEQDGQVDFGWTTPNFYADEGGQPPDPPEFSVPADYLIARHADVAYDTCAEAEAALLGTATNKTAVPYEGEATNSPPFLYLRSSLGSSLTVDAPTSIHAEATDPDGDLVRLSIILYGVAPDDCDWAQCNSKTMTVSAMGHAEIDFTNRWPLPGRYIVRMIATDYKDDMTVQDVPFMVYKIGDDNKTAQCCKYSAEMPVWHHRTGLHHKKWTSSPAQYQTLHDCETRRCVRAQALHALVLHPARHRSLQPGSPGVCCWSAPAGADGIIAKVYPSIRLEKKTCNGLYYGGPKSTIIWGTYMNKLVGSSTRFVLVPTRGSSSEASACDSGNLYQHPTLDYAAVSPQTSGGKACGCTPEGTELLNVEGGAFDLMNQAFVRFSFGRFSFKVHPDLIPQVNSDVRLEKVYEYIDATYNEEELGYPIVNTFYRHYLFYEQMDPGNGMSGVGGGKKSQISGCDYAVGKSNWMITAHEVCAADELPLACARHAHPLVRTHARACLTHIHERRSRMM